MIVRQPLLRRRVTGSLMLWLWLAAVVFLGRRGRTPRAVQGAHLL